MDGSEWEEAERMNHSFEAATEVYKKEIDCSYTRGWNDAMKKAVEIVSAEEMTGEKSSEWTHDMEQIALATLKVTKRSIIKALEQAAKEGK